MLHTNKAFAITILAIAVLSIAYLPACAQIDNPSFESGLAPDWVNYTYIPVEGDGGLDPSLCLTGCIGTGCPFDLFGPPFISVPDGTKVCGVQASGYKKNAGVYQHFFGFAWTKISVDARTYSKSFGDDPYDNGTRVRMALVPGHVTDRSAVTTWTEFPWGPDASTWQTMSLYIDDAAGNYTLFIEAHQPYANATMSTLWDNVVHEFLPYVEITSGPTVTVSFDPLNPDTTARIEWTTDVPSNSRVDYGHTSSYGQYVEDTNLVTNHSVELTGLDPSSLYHFKVRSIAPDYGPDESTDATFEMPVQFSDFSVDLAANGLDVVFSWTTDVPTTTQLEYGETTSYGNTTTLDPTLTTSHSVTVSTLSENTLYHYRALATAPNYNNAASEDREYTTLPSPKAQLTNGSFEDDHNGEDPSIYPWVPYELDVSGSSGGLDGIIGPYPAGGATGWDLGWGNSFVAYDGSYFLGMQSNWAYKNGGVFQRVTCPLGQTRTFSVRFAVQGDLPVIANDTYVRVGIDPYGGSDPLSGDIEWVQARGPLNNEEYFVTSVTAESAGTRGFITVFVELRHGWAVEWHVCAVDDAQLAAPSTSMTIGELKNTSGPVGVVLSDKIVTFQRFGNYDFHGTSCKRVYIQEDDGSAGIAVLLPVSLGSAPDAGNKLTLTGGLVLDGMEAAILATSWTIDTNTYTLPEPLGVVQKNLGGKSLNQPAIRGQYGPSQVGLRVRLWGEVTQTEGFNLLYIDDGSNILQHGTLYGTKCDVVDHWGVSVGDYIEASGVLSIEYMDPDGTPATYDEYYEYILKSDFGSYPNNYHIFP